MEHERRRPGLGHGHHHDHHPADAGRGRPADRAQDQATGDADRRRPPTARSTPRSPRWPRRRRGAHQAGDLGRRPRRPARSTARDRHRRPDRRAAGSLTFTVTSLRRAARGRRTAARHVDGDHRRLRRRSTASTVIDTARRQQGHDHRSRGHRDARRRRRPPSTTAGLRPHRRRRAGHDGTGTACRSPRRPPAPPPSSPSRGAGTLRDHQPGPDAELKVGTRHRPAPTRSPRRPTPSPDPHPAPRSPSQQGRPGTPVTVSVASDPDAVAARCRRWSTPSTPRSDHVDDLHVDATAAPPRSRATTRCRSLAGQLLDAVSGAVGTDGSAGQLGLQLTKDGTLTFDKAKFTDGAERPTRPGAAHGRRHAAAGSTASPATPTTSPASPARACRASPRPASRHHDRHPDRAWPRARTPWSRTSRTASTPGTCGWRKRKETLTRQFTAMETALSSLKNQSTWLAGQISSLPSSRRPDPALDPADLSPRSRRYPDECRFPPRPLPRRRGRHRLAAAGCW